MRKTNLNKEDKMRDNEVKIKIRSKTDYRKLETKHKLKDTTTTTNLQKHQFSLVSHSAFHPLSTCAKRSPGRRLTLARR